MNPEGYQRAAEVQIYRIRLSTYCSSSNHVNKCNRPHQDGHTRPTMSEIVNKVKPKCIALVSEHIALFPNKSPPLAHLLFQAIVLLSLPIVITYPLAILTPQLLHLLPK